MLALLAWLCSSDAASLSNSVKPGAETVIAEQSDARRDVRRIALVIGNGAYRTAPLANPVRDARAVSDALRSLGFDVMHYEDATLQQMQEATRRFGDHLQQGGVGLFYFSGHGAGVAGDTLLLPADAADDSPAAPLSKGMDLRNVLRDMSPARAHKLNMVILDICLNDPLDPSQPSMPPVNAGLPHDDTLLAFATAPGSFAADGQRHGIFTGELLRHIAAPGQDLDGLFRRVADGVQRVTGGRQVPWVSASLSSAAAAYRFVHADAAPAYARYVPASEEVKVLRSRAILPKDSDEQYELSFWESIKDSNHASDYEAYLSTYPNGRFAALARARIARLRASAPAKPEAPAQAAPKAPAQATESAPPAKPAPERPRQPPAAKVPETKPAPAVVPGDVKKAEPAPTAPAAPSEPREKAASRPAGKGEIKDCPACPVLISVPAGTFTMGSNTNDPSEKPAHQVTIKQPFAIGKYEVTVEEWNACVDAGACQKLTAGEEQFGKSPVRDVSWDDAQQYVQWLAKISGKPYRLPTEAEWELAIKGGTNTRFWWGEQMRPKMANCKDCGEPWQKERPVEVGSFEPNPFGLYDMNGSVWEWVADCWHNSHAGAPPDGRARELPNCRARVIRGGSWREDARYMPSSTRFKYDAGVRHSQNGFRVARTLD
jgi:formylglycine-generating enzyme required for sulfatase activity